ncbi:MAG: hypothetical protein ORN27_05480, partial [Rhodoluna sp.]|nr:hypothetical protein [Rhodoluna sp.]
VVGIAVIFGAVYGISALLERKRSGAIRTTTTKTNVPDDDPEFLRNLARRLAEEEAKKQNEAKAQDESGEENNDK